MPHVFAPHEYWGVNEEGHGVMFKWAAVTISHEVIDQPGRTLRVCINVAQ
jgi:hypothetical protein